MHLSQADLGVALGVPRNTIARWERGELEFRHADLVGFALDRIEAQAAAPESPHRNAAAPTNLPNELNSFVGREQELTDLKRMLETTRLLTLTGVGGVGKTRLALRLAHEILPRYPDGVWFVDLAPLVDARLVAYAVGAAVQPAMTSHASLAQRRGLLVLDNCEHILEGCAEFVATLLRSGDAVRVLATSREPLGLTAESVYRVQPLQTVDPCSSVAAEKLLDSPAIKLLLDRAASQSARTDRQHHARALAEICWRLDGLPLALELAAARLTILGPTQLADRLDNALGLLSGGSRDTPKRQQTLRATLDWSYRLLSNAEQTLFARLSVFAGGWTLEACEDVAGGPGIEPSSVLELLSQLIAKSLVVTEPGPLGTVRYRLLEPVRQYAHERLECLGDVAAIRARHWDWYVSWADRASLTGRRPLRSAGVLEMLDADIDNLRLAFGSIPTDSARVDRLVRAAGRLWWFWTDRGRGLEGCEYTRELLERVGDVASPASRAQALVGAGLLAWHQHGSDLAVARELLEEAVVIQRQLSDTSTLAGFVTSLARVVRDQGDRAAACRLLEESLHLAESASNWQTVARSLHGLGTLAHEQGDFRQAMAYFDRSLQLSREIGDDMGIATELSSLAVATYHLDEIGKALSYAHAVLVLRRDLGARAYQPGGLSVIAGLAARSHQAEPAARLYGAANRLREQVGVQGDVAWSVAVAELIRRDMAYARSQIGAAAFVGAVAAGRSLTLEAAVAEALALIEQITFNPRRGPVNGRWLTRRENEVAALIARGMTNRQIAAELVLTESTAAKHVEHIRDKLGFTSRSQIAAYVTGLV